MTDDDAEWLWDGNCAVDKVTDDDPPVAPTPYPEPAPTTNLSVRLGVELLPSQRTKPLGILPVLPDHKIIIPLTNADGTLTENCPFDELYDKSPVALTEALALAVVKY